MNRYKIARIIDQMGWCYHFIAREHAKYSKHQIIPVKYDNVDVENYDLVYIHSPNICTHKIEKIVENCKNHGVKLIGGYAGDPAYWGNAVKKNYDHLDLAVGISPETYSYCVKNYPGKAIFMPESIDDEFFVKRVDRGKWNFVIGWAGGLHKQVKRSHLLKKLRYPVKVQSKWDVREFVESRTQGHMVDFYNEIDLLVLTSVTECQPRVVLEAMSCGKPVISTDVGNIRMLLDERWIVPRLPEDVMLNEMNDRLDVMRNDKKAMVDAGERNREYISKCFSWKANVAYWDLVFENVIKGDIDGAITVSEMYLTNNNLKGFLVSHE